MGTTTQKMTAEQQPGAFTRRQFPKASGVLVVFFDGRHRPLGARRGCAGTAP